MRQPQQPSITYRPNRDRAEWLRNLAFHRRVSKQHILDQALDMYRAAQPTEKRPPEFADLSTHNGPIPGQYDPDGQATQ